MSAISHIKYLVGKYRGYWTVSSSGKANGEFANRGEACHSALQDGIRVGNLGHDVKIEAHERNGDTRTVWTSGAKKLGLTPTAHPLEQPVRSSAAVSAHRCSERHPWRHGASLRKS
jgi:hypothetical protein